MKYSPIVKVLAIILAAVCLMATLASAAGILVLIRYNLYTQTLDDSINDRHYHTRQLFAGDLLTEYAALQLGDFPAKYMSEYFPPNRFYADRILQGHYAYIIYDETGKSVRSTYQENVVYDTVWEITDQTVHYPSTHILPGDKVNTYLFFDNDQQQYVEVVCATRTLKGYTLRLYLKEDAYKLDSWGQLMTVLYGIRYWLFAIFGGALLLTVILMIYLCRAAGRTSGSDEVRPRGLSRLPLDLHTAAAAFIAIFGLWLGAYLIDQILEQAPILLAYLAGLDGVLLSLIFVGLVMAWAAQIKMKQYYWLKNTVVGRILRLILRALKWFLAKITAGIHRLKALTRQLPIILRRAGTVIALMLSIPVCIILASMSHSVGTIFWVLVIVGLIFVIFGLLIYDAYAFGTLLTGAKKMAGGDLDKKINTSLLRGDYYDFADELNSMSDAVTLAAEKQLRSERMKAELITNVSHDIKTPLTSIINFVDLLQKPHTDQQREEYLAVLARQSTQMKKLIEDLTELSKATTGNITVCAQKMDAVEAVNQALGEFSDKLDSAGLIPVFRCPEEPVYIHADGRLVWRVLSNLLGNAVKYALPGTRLYVTLTRCDDRVALSLKNVSKEELRLSAEDLLERFVQGDASRNAEGSGLGLNIAKGLMESQQGTLSLLLDGDLFKVTLTFPAAE